MTPPICVPMPPKPMPTISACATLACLWEATAPKPGNVYRGADFEDLSYVDFLTSAALVGPLLESAAEQGVGLTVLEGVQKTRMAVGSNTNLGILLLLAPLAAVPAECRLAVGIGEVLAKLSLDDTEQVYEAIRLAQPGGLGQVETGDVHAPAAPAISLVEAMRLASDRDTIARQYVSDFERVFTVADQIEAGIARQWALSDAIVYAYLQLLAEVPDSLIERKCGQAMAREVSTRTAAVLTTGRPGDAKFEQAIGELDFWLRVDGHRRNPGTSADLIAAALFVLLREDQIEWPVTFYRPQTSIRKEID